MIRLFLLASLFVLLDIPPATAERSPGKSPPAAAIQSRQDPSSPAMGSGKRLRVRREPRRAVEAMAPIDEEPRYCGDDLCTGSETPTTCPADCAPPPPALTCDGLNLRSLNELGDNEEVGPSPVAGGDCNCVVRIDTTRRSVTGHDLYQECNGHFGHGSCPPGCSDSPHSPGFGRWGVEISSPAVSSDTALSGAVATEPSQARDWKQWASAISSTDHQWSWNTCTCDPEHFPDANPVATERVRAGWFKIQSSAPTCASLATGPIGFSALLQVFELDPGFLGFVGDDDLVLSSNPGAAFGHLNCDGANGVCTAAAPILLSNGSGTVTAQGEISIECRSRPFCQSQCGVSRQCGTDSCGNHCGDCPPGQVCSGGQCQSTCTPCLGQECGFDLNCGSGLWCGSCPPGASCDFGLCEDNCMACRSQSCGWDFSCGPAAFCGDCIPPFECFNGTCTDTSVCVLDCGDGECCGSESNVFSEFYCPADCGGGGGGDGGGGGGGGGCTCDCDGDGWVTTDECTGGCGGRIEGELCVVD